MITATPVKITALLPEDLLAQVKAVAAVKTVTEALKTAMEYYLSSKRLADLNERVRRKPLQLKGFSAEKIRALNRCR